MASNPFSPEGSWPFSQAFMPLKLMFKSWEPCSFAKVPDGP